MSKDLAVVEEFSSIDEVEEKSWFRKLVYKLEVQHKEPGMTTSQMYLYNFDLRPLEEKRRLWSWFNYIFFWISDSFNINTWQIASLGLATGGMNWYQAWLSVWVGYFLCGIFITISARVGIFYHISFPISARSSFGIYGALWPVINRIAVSCIWYAVQCSVAAPCISVMLRAVFGKDLDQTMPNGIHNDPDLTTFKFLSFFLFWLFSLPFIWLQPHQVRWLFTVKSWVVPPVAIAFLAWTLSKAGGAGPVLGQKATLEGSALAWAFVESTMNALSNFVTLITNAPDFSRMANKPSFGMKYLVHTISVPLCFSITSLIGILVTSASTTLYGETYWSPLDVLGRFLDDYTPANRAGVFIIGLAFALAQLGTNISANSLSFGTDVTAIMPRFMNIRRGGYLCAFLALAILPWKLTSSSNKFTTYLSAYSVFLSSIAGVGACDYYYVRRGYLKLTHLYSLQAPEDKSVDSIYKFNKFSINWRAYAAYLAGIVPNVVGFAAAVSPDPSQYPIGAIKVYRLNYFMGFCTAFLIYAILCRLFPIAGMPEVGAFQKGWFEEWQDVEDFEDELTGKIVHGYSEEINASDQYSTGVLVKKV